jgi:glycosyltransferase involved in cell wall biosynthesis
VSVVIPTYNRGHLLPRAIQSVLAQTFSDFELIVVDDGSTDHTIEVVRGFADPRIRWLGDTMNRGPSAARNKGVREARCGLVAFLDSDDEWLPRKLDLQVARLDADPDPRTAVAYCRVCTYDDLTQRPVHEFGEPREGALFHDLLTGWHPVTTSLFLVRRAALLEVDGFDETLLCGEDYDLWLRLAQATYRFVAVNEVLVVKHENAGGHLSKDPLAKLSAHERMIQKWRPTITRHLGRGAYRRWRGRRGALLQHVYFERVREAASGGQRADTWRWTLAMLKSLPWSRAYVGRALALVILGPRARRAIAHVRAALARRSLLG